MSVYLLSTLIKPYIEYVIIPYTPKYIFFAQHKNEWKEHNFWWVILINKSNFYKKQKTNTYDKNTYDIEVDKMLISKKEPYGK